MQVLSPNREANRQAPPPRDDRPSVPGPRTTPSQGSKLALDSSAKPRRTGLQLPVSLPFDTWRRIGHQISLIADSSTLSAPADPTVTMTTSGTESSEA
ncbi:hypothetical protein ACWCSH_46560, partial [Streptosporangium sp. NPDC001682]